MGGMYTTKRAGTGSNFDLEKLEWVELGPTEGHACNDPGSLRHGPQQRDVLVVSRSATKNLFVTPQEADKMSIMEISEPRDYIQTREFFLGQPGHSKDDLPGACRTCSLPVDFKNRLRGVRPTGDTSRAEPGTDKRHLGIVG